MECDRVRHHGGVARRIEQPRTAVEVDLSPVSCPIAPYPAASSGKARQSSPRGEKGEAVKRDRVRKLGSSPHSSENNNALPTRWREGHTLL